MSEKEIREKLAKILEDVDEEALNEAIEETFEDFVRYRLVHVSDDSKIANAILHILKACKDDKRITVWKEGNIETGNFKDDQILLIVGYGPENDRGTINIYKRGDESE